MGKKRLCFRWIRLTRFSIPHQSLDRSHFPEIVLFDIYHNRLSFCIILRSECSSCYNAYFKLRMAFHFHLSNGINFFYWHLFPLKIHPHFESNIFSAISRFQASFCGAEINVRVPHAKANKLPWDRKFGTAKMYTDRIYPASKRIKSPNEFQHLRYLKSLIWNVFQHFLGVVIIYWLLISVGILVRESIGIQLEIMIAFVWKQFLEWNVCRSS